MLFKSKSRRLEMVIEKIQNNKDSDNAEPGEKSSLSSIGSEQASPISSAFSDTTDICEDYTLGATATTPYECYVCKRAFARSSLLSKHVQKHSEQLKFSCPYCKRLFKHKRSRDRHTKLHTGDKKYKCLHCESAFARSDHLKIHMKTHDNKKPHQCDLCNRGYNTAAGLASHQQHHSKQEQAITASRASVGAQTTTTMTTSAPGSTAASGCASRSASRSSGSAAGTADGAVTGLANSSTSSPTLALRCTQCPNAIFEKQEQYQNHLLMLHRSVSTSTTPQPNSVDHGAVAAAAAAAAFNIFKTSIPKVACVYCGKDFYTMNQLYQHIHLDHPAIAYNNISVSSSNIGDHSSPRQQKPTYACDRCTMCFSSSKLLQDHVENVHWGPPVQQNKPTDLSRKRRTINNFSDGMTKQERKKDFAQGSVGSPYDTNDRPCICAYCYAEMPNFKMFLLHMESHVALNVPPHASSQPSIQHHGSGAAAPIQCAGAVCPLCGEVMANAVELGRHVFGHTIEYVEARCCPYCKKPFEQLDLLQKHFLDEHSETLYKCSICNEIFETQSALHMHFSNKHSSDCKHYRCNLCTDQVFHDRLAAELHVNMKHSIQTSVGPTVNYQHQHISAELNTTSPDYQTLQCPLCHKILKDDLQYMHILKEHHNTREGEAYLLEVASLSRHLLPSESPNYLYSSSKSNAATVDPTETSIRNKHEVSKNNTNVESTNFGCDSCTPNDITNEADLTAHKKLYHAKSKVSAVSLQCAYCNEHCKSRNDLENHMKTHQVSCSYQGKHKCNICDEIFSASAILAEHKLTHCKIITGNNCTQCKVLIADEQSFYSHQVQHSNSPAMLTKTATSSSIVSLIPLPTNCIICCQTLQTDVEVKLHAKFHLKHLFKTTQSTELLCGLCNKLYDIDSKHPGSLNVCNGCTDQLSNGIVSFMTVQNVSAPLSPLHEIKVEPRQLKTYQQSDEDKGMLECHLCRNVLSSPEKLQIHLIEHNFIGIDQYRCYVCSSVFTTAAGLQSHIVAHGSSHQPYECLDCRTKFFFESELENHRFEHLKSNAMTMSKNGDAASVDCKNCMDTFPEHFYNEHLKTCFKSSVQRKIEDSFQINAKCEDFDRESANIEHTT